MRWLAFYELEPFGPQIESLRAGIIASTIANAWTGGSQSAEDFMPRVVVQAAPDPDLICAQWRAWWIGARAAQEAKKRG